jgi:peptidoglycan/xylan/chitin deacetylase (PgdA/CDA1 family)
LRADRLFSLYVAGILSPGGESDEAAIPILMYHGISNDTDEQRGAYFRTVTRPATFASHMQLLADAGYEALTLSRAHQMVTQSDWSAPGNPSLDRKAVVITFDDGLQDVYTDAFPILAKHGFSASVFLSTAYIGRAFITGVPCLTAPQIRELATHGIEFGSHTVSHPRLVELAGESLTRELVGSRHQVEDITGVAATSFSYPYRFPEENVTFVRDLEGLLRAAGYTEGVTTVVGRWRRGGSPLFLPRLPVNDLDDGKLLRAKLRGHYDWIHGVQLTMKRLRALAARPTRIPV